MTKLHEILNKFLVELRNCRNGADDWLAKDGGRRNELASQAARNNFAYGEKISNNPVSVIKQLQKMVEHCRHWEGKFAEWGGHDNDYARHCHAQGANYASDALQKVRHCANEINGVRGKLRLILSST